MVKIISISELDKQVKEMITLNRKMKLVQGTLYLHFAEIDHAHNSVESKGQLKACLILYVLKPV